MTKLMEHMNLFLLNIDDPTRMSSPGSQISNDLKIVSAYTVGNVTWEAIEDTLGGNNNIKEIEWLNSVDVKSTKVLPDTQRFNTKYADWELFQTYLCHKLMLLMTTNMMT